VIGTQRLARAAFVVLLVATVATGLLVHLRGEALGTAPQDVLGDALWAMMIAWWFGLLLPHVPLPVRAAGAYALCALVELSQLVRTPWLTSIRAHPLGHLVLGSAFDARDLVAYGAGIVAAVVLEGAMYRVQRGGAAR
jgi:hypothetical protein